MLDLVTQILFIIFLAAAALTQLFLLVRVFRDYRSWKKREKGMRKYFREMEAQAERLMAHPQEEEPPDGRT